jgi:hypothetical protein
MAFVPYGNPEVAPISIAAGLFYLVAYAITNFGAWGVVIALERETGRGLELNDYAGLARKHPLHAAAMAIFMLSLIGLPPTIGLVGKFYLFRAVIAGGFSGLAIIGADLSDLRLLLPARDRDHVHARGRTGDGTRILPRSHNDCDSRCHGGHQPRTAVPVRLGKQRGVEVVLVETLK